MNNTMLDLYTFLVVMLVLSVQLIIYGSVKLILGLHEYHLENKEIKRD